MNPTPKQIEEIAKLSNSRELAVMRFILGYPGKPFVRERIVRAFNTLNIALPTGVKP